MNGHRVLESAVANRTYLLAVDDRAATWSDDPEREIIAEGIGEIPVFWAALFVREDRQVDDYEGEGDGGKTEVLKIPNWCVGSAVAKERLAALREPIGKLLDRRSKKVWQLFVDHISAENAAFFKTNAAELWGLAPDAYEGYWGTLLRLFAEPTRATLKAAVEANDLSLEGKSIDWDDEEETACKLAGADHIREVPWLDD